MKTRLTSALRAFTLIELLVVIAIIAILAALLLPALGRSKAQAKITVCINQNRETAVGLRLWSNDNEGLFPWNVEVTEGGSKDDAGTLAVWADHFRTASNELVTPKILTCPVNKDKTVTDDWLNLAGLDNIGYFAGLSAKESNPQSLLIGDYNIVGGGGGLTPFWVIDSSIDIYWDNTVHVSRGIITLSDGSVRMTTTPQLKEQVSSALTSGTQGTNEKVVISLPQGTL